MSLIFIACLAALLVVPAIMVYAGYKRQKLCNNIGAKHGYTTPLSLSRPEAWAYAQNACVKRYMISGVILAVISMLMMTLAADVNAAGMAAYAATLLLFELIVWGFVVISVESGLRKLLGVKE